MTRPDDVHVEGMRDEPKQRGANEDVSLELVSTVLRIVGTAVDERDLEERCVRAIQGLLGVETELRTMDGATGAAAGAVTFPLTGGGVLVVRQQAGLRAREIQALALTADAIGIGLERLRNETLLRSSAAAQNRLTHAITENATMALLVMDARQRCTFMNPAAEAMTGYTFEQIRELDRPLHDIIHHHRPDGTSYPMHECPIDRALPTRAREAGEDVFVHEDGHFYSVAFTASPIVEEGRPVGTVIEVRDSTAAKQAERAIKMQARVLESMAEGVSVADEDGVILYTNDALDAMFGYGRGELIGKHVSVQNAYPPAENARVVRSVMDQIRDRGEWTGEWENLKKDGARFVTRSRITALDLSGRLHFVSVQADITEEKRARDASNLIAQVSTILVSSLDHHATALQVAARAVPLLGCCCAIWTEGADGKPALLASAIGDPAWRELGETLAAHGPEPDAPENERRLRALGMTSLLVVPLAIQTRTLGRIAFVRAGGRRHDSEDRALAEELGRRVGIAIDNALLFAMSQEERKRAEEASRAKDELLAVTSHELRTPLNAILGWTRMLRMGAVDPKRQAAALETIERNARAQVQLIEDLLDVNRVITGRLRLEVTPVDFVHVVDAAVDVIRPAADGKGVTLQVQKGRDVGAVRGDAGRLQQIVWNMLSNAVKFTPRGGRVELTVVRHEEDGEVELTVKDTGAGIAPEFLRKIFQPFRQEDASMTRVHGGLGLGLAIVEHLVELHGGRIEARSEGKDRGSTFIVRLPTSATRARESMPPAIEPAAPPVEAGLNCPKQLDGLRVLVVDDEPDALELLGELLEQCGVQVSTASSANEALDRIAAEPPDVLVSDIGMPEKSGYDLIREVRKLPSRASTMPAVALTAFASLNDRTRALLEGFTTHLAKPVEPRDLISALAALASAGAVH